LTIIREFFYGGFAVEPAKRDAMRRIATSQRERVYGTYGNGDFL
jgi:hypothetical protein